MWRTICASVGLVAIAGAPTAAFLAPPTPRNHQAKPTTPEEVENLASQKRGINLVEMRFQKAEQARQSGDCDVFKQHINELRFAFAFMRKDRFPPELQEAWRQRVAVAAALPCPPPTEQPARTDQILTAGPTGSPSLPEWDLKEIDRKAHSAPNRTLLIIGAAGAAGAGVLAAGGGKSQGPGVAAPLSPPAQQTQPPQPAPAPPAPPATPTPDSFNGTHTGNLTATENGCRFPPTAAFTALLNVNSSGIGTLQFTYLAPGQQQLYVFNNVTARMNGNQGSFEAETTSAQFGYRLIIQATLAGNTLAGRISFFGPGNCHTGYTISGTTRQ